MASKALEIGLIIGGVAALAVATIIVIKKLKPKDDLSKKLDGSAGTGELPAEANTSTTSITPNPNEKANAAKQPTDPLPLSAGNSGIGIGIIQAAAKIGLQKDITVNGLYDDNTRLKVLGGNYLFTQPQYESFVVQYWKDSNMSKSDFGTKVWNLVISSGTVDKFVVGANPYWNIFAHAINKATK